jgi:hypothetical protein
MRTHWVVRSGDYHCQLCGVGPEDIIANAENATYLREEANCLPQISLLAE